MLNINKDKVFICAAPRSGSTALLVAVTDTLKKTYPEVKMFHEPYTNQILKPQVIASFKETLENNVPFVMKEIASHLPKDDALIEKLFNDQDVFRIRIRRRNVLEQITSFYICKSTNTWHNKKSDLMNQEVVVPIDRTLIQDSISTIRFKNRVINSIEKTFDLDLYYEDDLLTLENSLLAPYKKPANYEEVFSAIQKTFEE